MVKAADVRDEKSLRAWLEGQPREDMCHLATRAALRVIPIALGWAGENRSRGSDFTELTAFRPALALAVAAADQRADLRPAAPAVALLAGPYASAASPASAAPRAAFAAITNAAAALADADEFEAGNHRAACAVGDSADAAATHLNPAAAASVSPVAPASVAGEVASATRTGANAVKTVWDAVASDAAGLERGENVTALPLWPNTPHWVTGAWQSIRARLSVLPAAASDFWIRWYDGLLDPAAHPAIPPEVLHHIARIPEDTWFAGPEAVAKAIAEIEAAYAGEAPIERAISTLPPAAPGRVEATRQAMERHRADLPPTFDAILGYIALEIHRLQTRNDDPNPEETKRQIKALLTIHRAVEELRTLVPKGKTMPVSDAEKAEKLARLYLEKFKAWPRDHVDDLVGGVYAFGGEITGNTIRMGLVAGTAYVLPMLGIPSNWALGAGLAVFGNKTIAEAAKFAKDQVFPPKP